MLKWLNDKRYWIIGAAIVFAAIFFVAHKQQQASREYRAHRAKYCTAFTSTEAQKESCIEEKASADDYLPWGYKLFVWPDGVGAWAIILTGIAIAWQSYETRRSAAATEKSVAVARRQIEMIKDKERAKVRIEHGSLSLEDTLAFWHIESDVKISNLGYSRAYIDVFQTELAWYRSTDEKPLPDFPYSGNFLNQECIEPTNPTDDPITAKAHNFDTESIKLDWFALAVYERRVKVLMRVLCIYKTVGSTYQRVVEYDWRPTNVRSSAGILSALYDNTPPTTNKDRVSSGYWDVAINTETELHTENQQ